MQDALPGTLDEWLTLLIHFGTVAAAVGGFLWYMLKAPLVAQAKADKEELEREINGLGGRVKYLEESRTRDSAIVDKHDRAIERIENAMVEGQGRVARIEGSIERLVTAIERNRDAHAEEDSEIRERLVRIETKVDAIQKNHP